MCTGYFEAPCMTLCLNWQLFFRQTFSTHSCFTIMANRQIEQFDALRQLVEAYNNNTQTRKGGTLERHLPSQKQFHCCPKIQRLMHCTIDSFCLYPRFPAIKNAHNKYQLSNLRALYTVYGVLTRTFENNDKLFYTTHKRVVCNFKQWWHVINDPRVS